jgi:GxxExxY protein
MDEKDRLDGITRRIFGAAIEVHRNVGPGLLESAYEVCLAFELEKLQLKIARQVPLLLLYKEVKLDCSYRLDMVVEDEVVVEIKAVEKLMPIHEAQVLSYLRISRRKVGLLINSHERLLKNGLKRIVNDFPNSAISATSAVNEFPDI